MLRIGGLSERKTFTLFSTPFSRDITEVLHPKKVKMPTNDPFYGTTDMDDYLHIYKVQMYIQDVDGVTYCRYFPATLK